uniref:Uncharacterized protein n=1 Tax=Mola mola TaxID=94237 RepID=A0A3Q3WXW4_MOLML
MGSSIQVDDLDEDNVVVSSLRSIGWKLSKHTSGLITASIIPVAELESVECRIFSLITGGLPGIQGLMGSKGLKGDKGDQGKPGNPGLDGQKGDRGEQGGCKCTDGRGGNDGRPGDRGYKGDKGNTGAQGVQGLTRLKGNKGDMGLDGLTGPCSPVFQSVLKVGLFCNFYPLVRTVILHLKRGDRVWLQVEDAITNITGMYTDRESTTKVNQTTGNKLYSIFNLH